MLTSLFSTFESVMWYSLPLSILSFVMGSFYSISSRIYEFMFKVLQTLTFVYRPYMSIVSGLFTMLLVSNMLSLIPMTYSISSMSVLTLSIGSLLWFCSYVYLFQCNYKLCLAHFLPVSTPASMSIFLVWVEFISLLARPIALSVRLMANITAGHLLLHLFSLSAMSGSSLVMCAFFIFMLCLEISVSGIQAYVFSLLLSLYIGEND